MNAANDEASGIDPRATPKLAEALAKAQGAFQTASKDKTNPHFGSKYADLASIMEACRGPLSTNGLSFVQVLNNDDKGVLVVTRLMHVSGESIESPCWLPVAQKTPQGYGSAITYARRYGFATLIGIAAEEDDDGNAASGGGKPPAPNGTNALKSRMAEDPGHRREHSDMVMGNFGRSAGKKLSDLSDEDLIFYRTAAKKTLADPAKAKFHENETKRLVIFDAEIRFRELPVDDASGTGSQSVVDKPKVEAPKTVVGTAELRADLRRYEIPYDDVQFEKSEAYVAELAGKVRDAKKAAAEKKAPGVAAPPVDPTTRDHQTTEKLPHQLADEKKAAAAALGPVMNFGPRKSTPVASLSGPELLEMLALGESKIGSLSQEKADRVRACLSAIKAEQAKREAALLEPGSDLDVD